MSLRGNITEAARTSFSLCMQLTVYTYTLHEVFYTFFQHKFCKLMSPSHPHRNKLSLFWYAAYKHEQVVIINSETQILFALWWVSKISVSVPETCFLSGRKVNFEQNLHFDWNKKVSVVKNLENRLFHSFKFRTIKVFLKFLVAKNSILLLSFEKLNFLTNFLGYLW